MIPNNFASIGRWQTLTTERQSGGPRGVSTSLFGLFLVGYFAVAVVKSSAPDDLTWNSLKGKKSCHTAVDRTAGWNIPMGLLYNRINHCEFGEWIPGGHCSQDRADRGILEREWYGTKHCCGPVSTVVKIWLKRTSRKYLKGMVRLGRWIRMVFLVAHNGLPFSLLKKRRGEQSMLIWSLETQAPSLFLLPRSQHEVSIFKGTHNCHHIHNPGSLKERGVRAT